MRHHHLAFGTLYFLVILGSQNAFAAGNVLLPSSTSGDTGSNSGNLGLTPQAPATPTPPQSSPTPPPSSNAQSTPSTTPAKSTDPALLRIMNAPDSKSLISPDYPSTSGPLPPGMAPTQVIEEPDFSGIGDYNAGLPETLTIGMSDKSYFGASDIDTINRKLGLTRDQIISNCILNVKGMMLSDKGPYIVDGGVQPLVTVHYDGVIKKYLLSARAECLATNLPPGGGLLIKSQGRFSVSLLSVDCPPPTAQASQLVITYTGTPNAQCFYH